MDRLRQWLKRLGCLLAIILWLLVMIFPTFAFVLAAQDQIQLGSQAGSHIRFFMVREGNVDGIGVEVKRPYLSQNQCYQNNLVYLLWEGDAAGQNSSFCQCYDPDTNDPLPVLEDRCYSP